MVLRVLSALAAIGLALGVSTALLQSQRAEPRRVGPQADGSTLLNSGWSLRPAGRQVQLGTFPMTSRITPDGKSYAYTYWTFEGELYLAEGLE